MRLKNDTPAKIALDESLKQTKKKIGRPPLTWIKLIEKDLSTINIKINIETSTAEKIIEVLEKLTASKKEWERIFRDIMVENR